MTLHPSSSLCVLNIGSKRTSVNPPGRLLGCQVPGDELCDFVLRSSEMTTTILRFCDPRLGSKGEFLDVLISRKVPVMYPLPGLRAQRTSFDREA